MGLEALQGFLKLKHGTQDASKQEEVILNNFRDEMLRLVFLFVSIKLYLV